MKYITIVFLILIVLSCNKNSNNRINSDLRIASDTIFLKTPVDSLLHLFMKKNKNVDCDYYLVTYFSCGQKILTFIATNVGNNYTLKQKSLTYYVSEGKRIYIITGVEELFEKKASNKKENLKIIKNPYFDNASYVISEGDFEYIPHGIPLFGPPPSPIDIQKPHIN